MIKTSLEEVKSKEELLRSNDEQRKRTPSLESTRYLQGPQMSTICQICGQQKSLNPLPCHFIGWPELRFLCSKQALATPFFMLHVWSRERGGLLGNRTKISQVASTKTFLNDVFGGGLGRYDLGSLQFLLRLFTFALWVCVCSDCACANGHLLSLRLL